MVSLSIFFLLLSPILHLFRQFVLIFRSFLQVYQVYFAPFWTVRLKSFDAMQWKNYIKNLTLYFNCIEYKKCIKYGIFTGKTGISLVTFIKLARIFVIKPSNVLLSRQLTLTGNLGGSFRPLYLSRPLFWLPWPRGHPWDSPAWGQYLIVGLHFPACFCFVYITSIFHANLKGQCHEMDFF